MQIVGERKKVKNCCGNCRFYRPSSMPGEPNYGTCNGPHVGYSRIYDKETETMVRVAQPIVNFGSLCKHHPKEASK